MDLVRNVCSLSQAKPILRCGVGGGVSMGI